MQLLKPLLITRRYKFRGMIEDFDQLMEVSDDYNFYSHYNAKYDEYEFTSNMSFGTVQGQLKDSGGIVVFGKIVDEEKENERLVIELFTRPSGGIVFALIAGLVLVIIGLTEGGGTLWLIALGFIASFFFVSIYRVQQIVLMEAIKNCFEMRRIVKE